MTAISVGRECGMIPSKGKVVLTEALPPRDGQPATIHWQYADELPVAGRAASKGEQQVRASFRRFPTLFRGAWGAAALATVPFPFSLRALRRLSCWWMRQSAPLLHSQPSRTSATILPWGGNPLRSSWITSRTCCRRWDPARDRGGVGWGGAGFLEEATSPTPPRPSRSCCFALQLLLCGTIYARMAPDQKTQLVEALQKME